MTTAKNSLHLLAPLSGQTLALDKVPDPVFAERLTGDGLAIQPVSDTVLAPCDGEITLLFDTKHAFAITTPAGVQVLVHVGLDTIIMNGQGITALHHTGDQVKAGEPNLKLDLDLLQKKHINLISPVLIVNYDRVSQLEPLCEGREVAAGTDQVLAYAV